jgi:[pyruvate, water dikinase]-phosphate phosphotransferase / [pyruvate, water dikinase] kinase
MEKMIVSFKSPIIFILSGGVGSSAQQVVNTALAQFPDNSVQTVTVGNIRQPSQVSDALLRAKNMNALVVHTLVDDRLRRQVAEEAEALGIQAVDMMGPVINWISASLKTEPLQQPGKYRQLHREYFDRVAAIDFTIEHDDGKNPDGWPQAEIILAGVSRCGKTPLSVYLAVLGWKVANIPLIPGIPVREGLFKLDPLQVIGLTIDPEQLLVYRRQRQARLGVGESSDYTDPESIREELRNAKRIFRQGQFHIINTTDKTIEQIADEIIRKRAGRTAWGSFV